MGASTTSSGGVGGPGGGMGGMAADSGSDASQEIAAWVTENFAATTVDDATVYDLSRHRGGDTRRVRAIRLLQQAYRPK